MLDSWRGLAALPFSLLLLQVWVLPGRDVWNVQSWSISVEVGLYLAAALLWNRLGARAYAVALATALAALLVLLAQVPLVSNQIPRGIGGFGLGLVAWRLWSTGRRPALSPYLTALLELAALPVLLWGAAADLPHIAMDVLFAGVILLFAGKRGPVSRILLTAPLVWLGRLSYALYMVHGLVFGRIFDLLATVQDRLGARWVSAHLGGGDMILLPTGPALLLAASMIAVALGVAWLAWRLVEWPARAWSRRLLIAPLPAPGAT